MSHKWQVSLGFCCKLCQTLSWPTCMYILLLTIQYRSNVSYHLSSRFSRDASRFSRVASRFSRYESRFSRESLNRLVWNILLAKSRCTTNCVNVFCLKCVVKSVKPKLSKEVRFSWSIMVRSELATPWNVGCELGTCIIFWKKVAGIEANVKT